MNLNAIQKKLIAAARAHPPDDQVPLAFEKRIMALIAGQRGFDFWAVWAQALWRAAAPCIALMILLSAWMWLHPRHDNYSTDLSQQFNNTMLAAVDQDSDTSW